MALIARPLASAYQRELVRLLTLAYGNESRAEDAISRTVTESGNTPLPEGARGVYEFVARQMVARLTSDLGPRVTMALLAELEKLRDSAEQAATIRPPPSSESRGSHDAPITQPRRRSSPEPARTMRDRARVMIVSSEVAQRIAWARTFIRNQCDVVAITSMAEVAAALDEDDCALAVVDLETSFAMMALDALSARAGSMPLLVCARDVNRGKTVLAGYTIETYVVCPRSATSEELVAIARQHIVRSVGT